MYYTDEQGNDHEIYLPSSGGNAVNEKSDSTEDSYSCDYVNKKLCEDIVTGVPCKTGRKIDGKDEYVLRVNFGSLPNTNGKKVDLPIDLSNCTIINYNGATSFDPTNNESYQLPYAEFNSNNIIRITLRTTNVFIRTQKDYSQLTAYINIYFTYNDGVD